MLLVEDRRTQEKGCFSAVTPRKQPGAGSIWRHVHSHLVPPQGMLLCAVSSEGHWPEPYVQPPHAAWASSQHGGPLGAKLWTWWLRLQMWVFQKQGRNCTTLSSAPWEVKQNNPHCPLMLKSECQGRRSGHCPLTGRVAGTPGAGVRPQEPLSGSVSPEHVTPFLIQDREHLCLLCESPPNSHP